MEDDVEDAVAAMVASLADAAAGEDTAAAASAAAATGEGREGADHGADGDGASEAADREGPAAIARTEVVTATLAMMDATVTTAGLRMETEEQWETGWLDAVWTAETDDAVATTGATSQKAERTDGLSASNDVGDADNASKETDGAAHVHHAHAVLAASAEAMGGGLDGTAAGFDEDGDWAVDPSEDATGAQPFTTPAAADVFVGVLEARPASPLFSTPSDTAAAAAAAKGAAPSSAPDDDDENVRASFRAFRDRERDARDDDDDDDDNDILAAAVAAAASASEAAPLASVPVPDPATPVARPPHPPPKRHGTEGITAADEDAIEDEAQYWASVGRMHAAALPLSPFEILFDGRLDSGRDLDDADIDLLVASLGTLDVAGPRPGHRSADDEAID